MPQIETFMLIGLGICLGALIALVVIRAAWKLAVQLGQRRAKRRDAEFRPAAELDEASLKAEYTKLRCRFELKVEDYKTQIAEQMAELSRARNQTEELKSAHAKAHRQREVHESEIAEHKETIATLKSDATEQNKQTQALENQIAEGKKSSKELAGTVATLRQELDAASTNADELRAEIATEQARITELIETAAANTQSLSEKTTRIAELEAAVTRHEGASAAHLSEFTSLTDELNQARRDSEKLHIELWKECDPELQPQVEAAQERLDRLLDGAVREPGDIVRPGASSP